MVFGRVKRLVKQAAPKSALRAYYRYRNSAEQARNAGLSPRQVFSEIYRKGVWGKGAADFDSGSGSSTQAVVAPYVAAISQFLATLPEQSRAVVDLGCGDFRVGRQLLPACTSYIGVDVVPDLIAHLQANVSDPRVSFRCMDIIEHELPPGDVCLVRQVFQHLSNAQISRVLAKLGRYRTVFITEHFPSEKLTITPNKDKVHGGGIRLFEDSAVYVERPPFNFAPSRMQLFLEVPDHGFDSYQPGTIRTFKFDLSNFQ